MNTFFLIILIICLAVQIPVWIFYFLNKKEIDEMTNEEMKKIYPDWPNVKEPEYDHYGIGGGAWFPGMF